MSQLGSITTIFGWLASKTNLHLQHCVLKINCPPSFISTKPSKNNALYCTLPIPILFSYILYNIIVYNFNKSSIEIYQYWYFLFIFFLKWCSFFQVLVVLLKCTWSDILEKLIQLQYFLSLFFIDLSRNIEKCFISYFSFIISSDSSLNDYHRLYLS